jgi:hypothetical protein
LHVRPPSSSKQKLVVLERQLLRKVCCTGIQSISPEELRDVARHSWVGPDHQAIFEALLRLANISRAGLRHQLPAEAARMGFPDVPWEEYFEPRANECESDRTTAELIAELAALSKRTR